MGEEINHSSSTMPGNDLQVRSDFGKGVSLSRKSSPSPFCVNFPLNEIQLNFDLEVKSWEMNDC